MTIEFSFEESKSLEYSFTNSSVPFEFSFDSSVETTPTPQIQPSFSFSSPPIQASSYSTLPVRTTSVEPCLFSFSALPIPSVPQLQSGPPIQSVPPVPSVPSIPPIQHTQSIPPVLSIPPVPSVPLIQHTQSISLIQHTQSIPLIQYTQSIPPVEPTTSIDVKDETYIQADVEGPFGDLWKYRFEHIKDDTPPVFDKGKVVMVNGVPTYQREPIRPDMTLLELVKTNCPMGWMYVFREAWYELIDIDKFLRSEEAIHGQLYPLKQNIFRAFELCPLGRVKVVIIGQDPYPGTDPEGQPIAQGMSFSIQRGRSIQPSLRNIYRRLESTISGFVIPGHGDLTAWAKRGVFLLNMSLSIVPGIRNSHRCKWMGFINRVIKAMTINNPKIVYMLWGNDAKSIKQSIGQNGIILESSHPSPLGAKYGFNSCNHFNEANQYLMANGVEPIDWNLPP